MNFAMMRSDYADKKVLYAIQPASHFIHCSESASRLCGRLACGIYLLGGVAHPPNEVENLGISPCDAHWYAARENHTEKPAQVLLIEIAQEQLMASLSRLKTTLSERLWVWPHALVW